MKVKKELRAGVELNGRAEIGFMCQALSLAMSHPATNSAIYDNEEFIKFCRVLMTELEDHPVGRDGEK